MGSSPYLQNGKSGLGGVVRVPDTARIDTTGGANSSNFWTPVLFRHSERLGSFLCFSLSNPSSSLISRYFKSTWTIRISLPNPYVRIPFPARHMVLTIAFSCISTKPKSSHPCNWPGVTTRRANLRFSTSPSYGLVSLVHRFLELRGHKPALKFL